MSRSSRRLERQNLKQRYSKLREEAQLAGVIHTTPEGAVRNERSDCGQPLPALVRQGLKENWATPDAAKPHIIEALLRPFFHKDVVMDAHGNVVEIEPDPDKLLRLAKLLRDLDQTQYERDNPAAAGMAKGGVALSVQSNQEAARIVRDIVLNGHNGSVEPMRPFAESDALGYGGHEGEMEASAAPSDDQRHFGEGLEESEQSDGDQRSIPAR